MAPPCFRIFNPVLQGEKFDPEGVYVRRWVPELREIPAEFVHRPWEAPVHSRNGKYPPPMIDHGFARERALQALKTLKAATA